MTNNNLGVVLRCFVHSVHGKKNPRLTHLHFYKVRELSDNNVK